MKTKIKMTSLIKKNIATLKEVVIKNVIKNNLYTLPKRGVEPNIIIEFAIYFEWGRPSKRYYEDWFEILYEKFEDDNQIVRHQE